ncbi:hypothetical protein Fcan01_08151 [Folsomia candida]|uniref:Transmembrane protein 135 N-terminal domain-containing protein n=1 Tax=Folsomia candida TaxID=158441 RepID=A0A226ELD2_FOLCA|nr:hypothetical protein Fcan01_08151 [Folsomia candida]
MAPAASKLATLPFNCYEIGHTWEPNCNIAAIQLAGSVSKEISLIASRRIPKSTTDIVKLVKDILRSTLFLQTHGLGYVVFLCRLRRMLGKSNFYTLSYLPTFLASYVSIMIEKPQRRPLLALYVTNVATETIYRMLRSRGMVRDIKHFDFFLFCTSMVTVIYNMKKGNRRGDMVDTILIKIFGPEEFTKKREEGDILHLHERQVLRSSAELPRRVSLGGPGLRVVVGPEAENANVRRRANEDTYRNRFVNFVLWMHKSVEDIASHLERMVTAIYESQIHEMCPHNQSCFDYWMEGFYSRFLVGCGIHGLYQTAMLAKNLLSPSRKMPIDKTGGLLSNSVLYPCIRSGMGLGMMNLAFRLINCSFRWLKGMDGPGHAAVSGFISSALGFLLLKPPNSLGLYLFFKAAESVISESHKKNNYVLLNLVDKVYGGGWCLLYSLSTALLFTVAIFEPHNLKPSYYHFLSKATGGKLFEINRTAIDIYGTNSSVFMKDFWPKLSDKYVSDHMKQLIKMRESVNNDNEATKELLQKFINVN